MKKQVMREHMMERFGKVFNYSVNPPFPKSLNIELNSTCNQACVFCPFHGKYAACQPRPAELDIDTVKKILEEAKRLGIGDKELGFYLSGEVFLYRDLDKAIRYAKELEFPYVFITTNGALASPERMKAVLDAGLDSIRFSVNASDRENYKKIHGTDDFEKVRNNIIYMHQYIDENSLNVATSISCVITKQTLGIQEEMKKVFGGLVDDILFIPVILSKLQCDEAFIEENQLIDDSKGEINEKYICPLLFDTMYISADLKVMPCCDANEENGIFYDLKKDFSLANAWNCESYQKYRNIFLESGPDKGTLCEKCILRLKGVERLSL